MKVHDTARSDPPHCFVPLSTALLAVPHAVALLGLAGAGISLAAVALAALTSQQLLISAARRGGRMRDGRYADAVRPALGGVGAAVADVALALTCFGALQPLLTQLARIASGGGVRMPCCQPAWHIGSTS